MILRQNLINSIDKVFMRKYRFFVLVTENNVTFRLIFFTRLWSVRKLLLFINKKVIYSVSASFLLALWNLYACTIENPEISWFCVSEYIEKQRFARKWSEANRNVVCSVTQTYLGSCRKSFSIQIICSFFVLPVSHFLFSIYFLSKICNCHFHSIFKMSKIIFC